MPISRETVQYIAHLAQLDLEEGEIEGMVRDMGAILDYVERLQSASGAGDGETAADPGAEGDAVRPDTPRPGLPPGEATRRAPGARGDLFRVPPAFGGE